MVYFLLALAIEYGGTLPWLAALLQLPGHYVDSLRAKWRRWRRRRDGGDGGYQQAREGGGSSHSDSEEDEEEEEEMDDDVLSEEQRVMSGRAGGDAVRLERLRKVYRLPGGRSKVAVRGLSFGIPKGETLGFLGINGAGKTTTLSILSGEFPPTSGRAFIAGHDIATEQNKLRRKIGYCPQFSALLVSQSVTKSPDACHPRHVQRLTLVRACVCLVCATGRADGVGAPGAVRAHQGRGRGRHPVTGGQQARGDGPQGLRRQGCRVALGRQPAEAVGGHRHHGRAAGALPRRAIHGRDNAAEGHDAP